MTKPKAKKNTEAPFAAPEAQHTPNLLDVVKQLNTSRAAAQAMFKQLCNSLSDTTTLEVHGLGTVEVKLTQSDSLNIHFRVYPPGRANDVTLSGTWRAEADEYITSLIKSNITFSQLRAIMTHIEVRINSAASVIV